MKQLIVFSFLISYINSIHAQPDRWQQKIKYTIDVDVNVLSNQFKGTEKIDY